MILVEDLEGSIVATLFGEVVLEKGTMSDEMFITTVTSFISDM